MSSTAATHSVRTLIEKGSGALQYTAEKFASYSVGQKVFRTVDKCLWIIEKSAEWSVPKTQPSNKKSKTEANGNAGKDQPLVRPLPWVLFLPTLLFLRLVRAVLNLAGRVTGIPKILPNQIVSFLQRRRRKLRAIRFAGLRLATFKKNKRRSASALNTVRGRSLSWAWSIVAMCYSKNLPYMEQERITVGTDTTNNNEDEDLLEKLDRLANESSDEDPDYTPSRELSSDECISSEELEDAPEADAENSLRPQQPSIKEEDENSNVESVGESDRNGPVDKEIKPVKQQTYSESTVNTSDEYYSPRDSSCPSPEPEVTIKLAEVANGNSNLTKDTK